MVKGGEEKRTAIDVYCEFAAHDVGLNFYALDMYSVTLWLNVEEGWSSV
jgi:hypothetical protein